MKIRILVFGLLGFGAGLLLLLAAGGSTAAAGPSAQVAAQTPTVSPWQRWQLTGSNAQAVDAVATNDAWIVGSDGLLTHWDGTGLHNYDNTLVGALSLNNVDMVASNAAWASAGSGQILRWDGTTWADQPRANGTRAVYDVSMVSTTDGWAVGSAALFMRYNGTQWSIEAPASTITHTMYSVDMVNSTAGWAVGGASDASGTVSKIARWNGTQWVDSYSHNRILYAADFLNENFGWVGGQAGNLLKWDGVAWTLYSTPSGAVTVRSISVVSPTEAYAVGARNAFSNDIWRFDGTQWQTVTVPVAAPLQGVHMLSSTDGFVVGDRGTVFRYDGTTWQTVVTHWTSNGFYALDFLSPNDGWTVGVLNASPPARGLQHWNGTDWEVYQPPVTQPTMYDVKMVASNDVWAIGSQAAFHWDGSAWTNVPLTNRFYYQMDMVSATDGWAVGSSGRIAHFDGTTWVDIAPPTSTNLWAIDMVDANEGWAGGTLGLMLHYQNGTWTPISPNPASFTIEAIHMLNANEGWAVGYNGTILHYTGGTWTPQASPVAVNLLGVHMISSTEGWAVGQASGGMATILHYTGGTWNLVPNPTGRPLRDVFMFADGSGWTVSESPGAKLYKDLQVAQTATPTATSTATMAVATPTSTACKVTFTDVPVTDPFYANIRCLACRGILGGYSDGTFRPYNDITRGQIAKVVSNAAGLNDDVSGRQTYTDVPSSNPFWVWIERLSMHGVMGGYNCGGLNEPCDPQNRPYFRWGANATRGQLSKIVSNAAGFNEPVSGQTFTDVPPSNPFYNEIERLATRGIMGGYECGRPSEPCDPENRPYFRWAANVTRGQASKIVANTFFPNCETPSR